MLSTSTLCSPVAQFADNVSRTTLSIFASFSANWQAVPPIYCPIRGDLAIGSSLGGDPSLTEAGCPSLTAFRSAQRHAQTRLNYLRPFSRSKFPICGYAQFIVVEMAQHKMQLEDCEKPVPFDRVVARKKLTRGSVLCC